MKDNYWTSTTTFGDIDFVYEYIKDQLWRCYRYMIT